MCVRRDAVYVCVRVDVRSRCVNDVSGADRQSIRGCVRAVFKYRLARGPGCVVVGFVKGRVVLPLAPWTAPAAVVI